MFGKLIFQPGFIIELVVIVYIIIKQWKSFTANKRRMDDYVKVFSKKETWAKETDELGRVSSIKGGASNPFFTQIKDTINKYIAGNSDSVMDFQIFKDAVERQCDNIEEQIESQTPVPLYLGLAGSMIGIIVGLLALVVTGDFMKLTGGDKDSFFGIASLLLAVAVAMVASLCGIVMTTIITNEYKDKKSVAEDGKNAFISWMQSELFPSLPNDMSFAMTQMVDDLGRFNETFEKNTNQLATTFNGVNEAYKTQADIVKAVKEMDVQSMAMANVRVLQALQGCTEKLERFNDYLDRVEGYTATIQRFNEQFQQEESRLGVMEEIRDFFKTELKEIEQRKAAISDAVSSVDDKLRKSFHDLDDHSVEMMEAFKEHIDQQGQQFKHLLDEQQSILTDACKEFQEKVDAKLQEVPESLDRLKDLAEVPGALRQLSADMQTSLKTFTEDFQTSMTTQMATAMNQLAEKVCNAQASEIQKAVDRLLEGLGNGSGVSKKGAPAKRGGRLGLTKIEKITCLALLSLITLSSVCAAVFCALTFFAQ
jgi:biopolymer transport protein ExbB/TolQ